MQSSNFYFTRSRAHYWLCPPAEWHHYLGLGNVGTVPVTEMIAGWSEAWRRMDLRKGEAAASTAQ